MDLVEMVLAKADPPMAELYDRKLVPENLHWIGQDIRNK